MATRGKVRDVRINGPALTVIRERSGMTLVRLAESAGIDRTTLAHIETGRRGASPETAMAIARALKVELPAILADPNEPAEVGT